LTPASPVPYVLATLDFLGDSSFTVKREGGDGDLAPRMDFKRDPSTVVSRQLETGDRVLVVYQSDSRGEGYHAKALLRCPVGTDPKELLKTLPKK
jgi:hypothetical protein